MEKKKYWYVTYATRNMIKDSNFEFRYGDKIINDHPLVWVLSKRRANKNEEFHVINSVELTDDFNEEEISKIRTTMRS